MLKKTDQYEITKEDESSTVYGSFHRSDIKRMVNALMMDLANHKEKGGEKKAKKSLLKRLKKLIDD
jgi:hypothetical protein